jgi:hypothetical protein
MPSFARQLTPQRPVKPAGGRWKVRRRVFKRLRAAVCIEGAVDEGEFSTSSARIGLISTTMSSCSAFSWSTRLSRLSAALLPQPDPLMTMRA